MTVTNPNSFVSTRDRVYRLLSQRERMAVQLWRKGYDTVDIAWLMALTEPQAVKLLCEAREGLRSTP